ANSALHEAEFCRKDTCIHEAKFMTKRLLKPRIAHRDFALRLTAVLEINWWLTCINAFVRRGSVGRWACRLGNACCVLAVVCLEVGPHCSGGGRGRNELWEQSLAVTIIQQFSEPACPGALLRHVVK